MIQAALIVRELKRWNASHVVGLPDNTSAALFALLKNDTTISLLPVTREGEAFALAAGLWIGGMTPVVLIQNTGLLECGDSFRGTVMRMRVPIVCLITYRGYSKMVIAGLPPASATLDPHSLSRADLDSVALMTEPTLKAWGIPYEFIHTDADLHRLSEAFEQARKGSQPVALLITEETV